MFSTVNQQAFGGEEELLLGAVGGGGDLSDSEREYYD